MANPEADIAEFVNDELQARRDAGPSAASEACRVELLDMVRALTPEQIQETERLVRRLLLEQAERKRVHLN